MCKVVLIGALIGSLMLSTGNSSAQPSSTDFAEQLKSLGTRFNSASSEKRDYQQLREIRADLRKIIPTIKARVEEIKAQVEDSDNQLRRTKNRISFPLVNLPPPTYYLSGPPTSPQPASPSFSESSEESIEVLRRKIEDLKKTLPSQVEQLNKGMEQIEQSRRDQSEILSGSDEGKKAAARTRSEQLDRARLFIAGGLDRYQRLLNSLDEAQRLASDYADRDKAFQALQKEQISMQRQAVEAENLLDRLDERAQTILSTDSAQNFFTMISTISFAALVGTIIILFFMIANKSDTVRNAIFAGDAGIQFITLFSLVIAIILFGVLRILEGKELAALLGGLSGYILGRGSQGSQSQRGAGQSNQNPNQQVQGQPSQQVQGQPNPI